MTPPPPHSSATAAPSRRLRLTLEYDGTAFLGFQRQARGRTVQGVLEAALAGLTPEPRVVAAGRTDAGVHATGQVVHCAYAGATPVERLAVVLNNRLPADLAVRACREADTAFHARYSALSRRYVYRVLRAPTRRPLAERYAWRVEGPLDLEAMGQACALLLGEHSFRRFGRIPGNPVQRLRSQASHGWRRTIYASTLMEAGELLCFTVEANAFLTHMVRALVGALIAVGRGRLALGTLQAALADEASDAALVPLAPAQGLCLVRVRYADDASDDGEHERLGPAPGFGWATHE